MQTRTLQRGVAAVEFAIIGVLLMVVLFAVIEMGRALYVMNTLTEATRRGARLAAVCPVGDPKPAQVAVFANGSNNSAVVSGLSTANISVQYLDSSGAALGNPTASFSSIHYVRVSIVGFTQPLVIPFLSPSIPMSGFSATLPRESLGVPRTGTVQPC